MVVRRLWAFALSLAVFSAIAQASAGSLTVLHSVSGADGATPYTGILRDKAGNLFGATSKGGPTDKGIIYELKAPAAGQTKWTETVIWPFTGGNDGAQPIGGLVSDKSGDLFGTTQLGGGTANAGVVFKLSRPAKGKTAWSLTILHRFNGMDGAEPIANLAFDSAGNIFGTTTKGGTADSGVVFKLSPPAVGETAWSYGVVHRFKGGSDGATPSAGVSIDASGNLFGMTTHAGIHSEGVAFKLTPPASGKGPWKEAVIHSFQTSEAAEPFAGLTIGKGGMLYGTTFSGSGPTVGGAVFELAPPIGSAKNWTMTILHGGFIPSRQVRDRGVLDVAPPDRVQRRRFSSQECLVLVQTTGVPDIKMGSLRHATVISQAKSFGFLSLRGQYSPERSGRFCRRSRGVWPNCGALPVRCGSDALLRRDGSTRC